MSSVRWSLVAVRGTWWLFHPWHLCHEHLPERHEKPTTQGGPLLFLLSDRFSFGGSIETGGERISNTQTSEDTENHVASLPRSPLAQLTLQRVVRDEQPTKRKSRWFKAKAETQHPPEKVPTSQEVLNTARTIFKGTINLRDVHFTDQISFKTIVVLGYLKNLEKLALNIGGYSIYLIYALRTQPRLKHLELLRAEGRVPFQSTDVQELRSLKAPLFEASEIVPGRPIETLELLDDSWTYRSYSLGVAENLFKDLTRSACEITDFTIRFGCSDNDESVARYLQLVARYLPSTERLCISSRHAVSDSLLLEILPAVGSLRHLKMMGPVSRKETDATTVLHETQQLQDDTPLYRPEDFGHFVRRLKGHCHGLIEVEWCRSETFHCSAEGEIPFRYIAIE